MYCRAGLGERFHTFYVGLNRPIAHNPTVPDYHLHLLNCIAIIAFRSSATCQMDLSPTEFYFSIVKNDSNSSCWSNTYLKITVHNKTSPSKYSLDLIKNIILSEHVFSY